MSSLEFKAPKNSNYAAMVVELKDFVSLPNCDNIQAARIFGSHVIVGKDAKAGDIGLFFPVETELSKEFLGANNLYRKPEWGNLDPEAKGFFEDSGRVKCVKFRGHKSEGFFIPLSSLTYINGLIDVYVDGSVPASVPGIAVGSVFDTIGEHEICRKYVSRRNPVGLQKVQTRTAKLIDQIVPGQFNFHTDTQNLRRHIFKVMPDDLISISDKWHGTSVVIARLRTVRKLRWYERILRRLGVAIDTTEDGIVYSSRKVIKSVSGVLKHSNHFYTSDIWGDVAKEVEDKIPAGYTLYGEIVGYTSDGSPIQAGYHYGCQPGKHKFRVYRVTVTNLDGIVLELSWPQLQAFCVQYGFDAVPSIYYGRAFDLFPETPEFEGWHNLFLEKLDNLFVSGKRCPHNDFEVPAEGIVLRIDHLNEAEAYKLKSFEFLEHESKVLDKGELDIETAESEDMQQIA